MNTEPGAERTAAGEELRRWCEACLGVAVELCAMPGDASFRRYFRVLSPPGHLAVYAPPALENIPAFTGTAALFQAGGVRVPAVYAADAARGFLLVEDLGEELFLHVLKRERRRAETLYRQALELLVTIQSAPRQHDGFRLPDYDEAELQAEMALFQPWFVEKLLGGSVRSAGRALLQNLFTRLTAAAREGLKTPVHRDYHSRNLMLLSDGALGTIDFQDAAWGSEVYDLVSLLKDCYVHWPRPQVESWAEAYRGLAAARGLDTGETPADFLRRLDLVGLQRHLKVLGIFARLHLRDGKSGYLYDLPGVIARVQECGRSYPELADFGDWFEQCVMPRLAQQSWMSAEA